MGLDLRLVHGKLVSINHLQTDGRTDKKMDRPTYSSLNLLYSRFIKLPHNFFDFEDIATKIALLLGKWLKDSKYGLRFEIAPCEVVPSGLCRQPVLPG